MRGWLFLLIIFTIGYLVGVKFPALGNKVGL